MASSQGYNPPGFNDRVSTSMERELSSLATALGDLRSEISQHYATKADTKELKADLIKWVVGTAIVAMGVAVGVATLVQRLIA